MNELTKVLIIEDSEDIIESVSLVLRLRWPQLKVIFTDKGEYGIELVEKESPELVILDIGLPDISGFEVLKSIRHFSSVPIVILTVRGEETDIVRGLELGADEYIVKPFRQLELLSRIKAIIRRQNTIGKDHSIVCGPLYLDPHNRTFQYKEKQVSLTCTESIILSKLMENAGNVVTHGRLTEEIWGDNFQDAAACIKVYIRRLREKIEDNPSCPKFVVTKTGLGYMLNKNPN